MRIMSAALRCVQQRSPTRSRYYVQVPADEQVEAWSDDRFWDELRRRLDAETAETTADRPIDREVDRDAAQLRGGAAAVWPAVPRGRCCPHRAADGRQGLNLAMSDVTVLAAALTEALIEKSDAGIDDYSARVLGRIWKAERFSWWMTGLLHTFPETGAFGGASSGPSSTISRARKRRSRAWPRTTRACRSNLPLPILYTLWQA